MAMFRSKKSEVVQSPMRWPGNRQDDPLTIALQPPPDESEEQRLQRQQAQLLAEQVSQQIDEGLLESKKVFEKRKKAVKILLLGQSESGKSTTLKNFQLLSSSKHFANERHVWKTIVQLNLIGNIKRIFDVLKTEWDAEEPDDQASPSPPTHQRRPSRLTDDHRRIRMRLGPLLAIETTLHRKLFPGNYDPDSFREVSVRAGGNWKTMLSTVTSSKRPSTGEQKEQNKVAARPALGGGDDPTNVLAACQEDIVTLWADPVIREVLQRNKVRLEDSPGFFLDETARIAQVDYMPTDRDIVRARLRTIGVEEHQFLLDGGTFTPGDNHPVYVYDVGGARSMRPHWVPYFDDVQAIIFLAPLAFNQVLEEDPKVNRLEDSYQVWRQVCSNPLLAKATIILFLNKMDILRATLASGIKVVDYVTTYQDLPNDYEHVTQYFRDRFQSYHKRLSPEPRPFICYETSAIDTRATLAMLRGVKDGILRAHLQRSYVL